MYPLFNFFSLSKLHKDLNKSLAFVDHFISQMARLSSCFASLAAYLVIAQNWKNCLICLLFHCEQKVNHCIYVLQLICQHNRAIISKQMHVFSLFDYIIFIHTFASSSLATSSTRVLAYSTSGNVILYPAIA